MNSVHQPGAGTRPLDRLADDLDGTLRAFFRAQMPEPWPDWKAPAMSSLYKEGAIRRQRSLVRSRFMLAASLLILSIGQLSVSSLFSGYVRLADTNRGGIEATHRRESSKPHELKPASVHPQSTSKPLAKETSFLDSRR